MIPSILARQLDRGVRDFIDAMFPIATPYFQNMLGSFLAKPGNVFKGPFYQLGLPFAHGEDAAIPFSTIRIEGFKPWAHQESAWKRLGGHAPASTLVATGTGSGKTECFLYPILDYCARNKGGGIKAILLYPMNALADDQARRIAELVHTQSALAGIRAGVYTGSASETRIKTMGERDLITDRETLREYPPDILLTNYKMLDLLLLRSKDRPLWRDKALKFLVVDELHSFDGAQGTDLACLIRRLRERLECADSGSIACVGTSATLGTGEESRTSLLDFARKVFHADFDDDSLIEESRQTEKEFLAQAWVSRIGLPGPESGALLEPFGSVGQPGSVELPGSVVSNTDEYILRQMRLWFPDIEWSTRAEDRIALGAELLTHGVFQNILRYMEGRARSAEDLAAHIRKTWAPSRAWSDAHVQLCLDSLFALVSYARRLDGSRTVPFLTVRTQFWMRELRRLVASVAVPEPGPDGKPETPIVPLMLADEISATDKKVRLPLVHCRECNCVAWLTREAPGEAPVVQDLRSIYNGYFGESKDTILLYPVEEGADAPEGSLRYKFCADCGYLSPESAAECANCHQTAILPVWRRALINANGKFDSSCPRCGSAGDLTIMGAKAASLLAALVGQTFSSPFNPDKKLLAFSDSVQDASHRAGFLTARAWTFSFRTAICSVLAASNDSCSLSEFSRRFLDYWKEKTGSAERFAGMFLPPDLEWFEDYEVLKSTGALPAGSDLAEKLSLRLCWEIASEFTFRSRIGRTLERTGTAIASFNPDALERAAVDVASEAAERQERFRLVEPSHPEWRRLLWGILYRFKNLGAVNEPSIRALFEYGSTFPFQRTRRHMPGFSKRAPHIVTAFSRTNIHESLAAVDKRKTWFEAWTARCAAALLPGFAFDSPDENAELLQLAIASLERAGLVSRLLLEKENTGWLIEPASLVVTQDVVRCRCSVCAGALDVADADRGLAEGMRCLRSGCRGAYRASDTEASDYYRNFYRRGEVVRINGREHTGLLGGKERKELEERFIAGADPWDPNLLSATPTLEMGINIGDLSTVFLCSVPPAVANYLQRIGRAGRVDGNANILTMANAAPHDQYFFQSPAEMLEGSIDAPAIYDRAVAVLERHLTAYAIGRWMKDMNALADPVPSTVGDLIAAWNGENYEVFPRAFDSALARESESWMEGFFSVFDHLETGGSEQAYLREWLSQDPATERTLVRTLGACLDSAASAVESMRSRRNALRKRAADIRAQGALTEELAKECEELDREADGLRSGIEQLRQTETWQYLCDEGILPNYAFPESGVKLKATFYRKNKNKTKSEFSYTHVELVRSASSALCEFAPENEFFGNGHRMKINRVDLKTSTLETWRFCPACSHAVSETHEHFKMSDCPVCRNPGWADAGQVHFLLRFRQVFSFSDYKSSLISDSQEDREPVFYNTKLLVDFDPADPENKYFGLEDKHAPFAIEFIKRATFREINFGRVDGGPQGFPVAGEDDSKSGFPVCTFCGSLDSDRHTPDCPDRAKSIADQSTKRVIHLYHEFRSEAIRLLAPVNEYPLQSEIALESTIAGIYLGLKKHFGGKADHLRITRERSETAGGARLHYIVVYDSIPGGSGYLKDFFTEAAASADGAGATTFFAVLEKALEALQNCRCKNDPEKDGCYRCVLSHKVSRKMKDVSRTMAIDVIQRMMVERANLRKLNEQAAARVDPLSDSKLEELFAAVLESPDRWPVAVSVKPEMFHGKTGRYVQIGSRGYHLEQQVPITVAWPYRASCLADFVFFPVANGERPVVVFTDGFRYHKDILAQDLRTRFALIQSGEYRVFSFSWEDIASIAENRPSELDRAKHPWLQPALAKEAAKRFQQFKIENSSWPGVKEDASPAAFVSMLSLCEADRDAQWLNKARHSAMLHFLSSPEAARPAAELSERAGTDFGKNQAFVTKKLSEQAAHELTLILGMGASFTVSSLDLWLEFDDSAELDRFEWNLLLDLVNLYQIFPHFACAAKSAAAEKDWMAYAFAGTDVKTAEAASEWAPVYDCVLSAWKPLVSQLADRNSPIPEVGFEEIDGSGTVLFTAELAWPELKIAVLAHDPSGHEPECGWTLLYWKPDSPFPEFDFGGNT